MISTSVHVVTGKIGVVSTHTERESSVEVKLHIYTCLQITDRLIALIMLRSYFTIRIDIRCRITSLVCRIIFNTRTRIRSIDK